MDAIARLACVLAIPTLACAQNGAKKLHLEGEQARILISLVASGGAEIDRGFKDGQATEFTLAELNAMKSSTFKYEKDDPYFKLDVYAGHIKLPGTDSYLPLTDCWATYGFLSKLGMPHNLGLEGDYVEAANVHRVIHPQIVYGDSKRFTCDSEKPL